MAGLVDTKGVNMNEFIRTRPAMSPEQAHRMITHHAVVLNYKKLRKRDYPEVEALEEAITEVFSGGMTRPMRVYKTLATKENVERIEAFIRGERHTSDEDLEVPDLMDLKPMLRRASDIAEISNLLVAERAGKNADGAPRAAVVRLLSDKIRELATPEEERKPKARAKKADIEDLAADD